jgi:hypothetical protein
MITVLRSAWNDFTMKIRSVRFLSALAMVLCLVLTTISGIDEVIDLAGEKITIWVVPHLFDNTIFATFYALIIIYLFSDVPFFDNRELYYMIRLGRIRWVLKKMLSMVITSVFFTTLSFLICILSFFPNINIAEDWGKVIRTSAFGSLDINRMCYMSQNIIYDYTPVQAMSLCFLMVLFVTVMTGFFMFAVSILVNKNMAVVIPGLIALLNFSSNLYITEKWLPKVNIYAWYRISIFNSRLNTLFFYPDVSYCERVVAAVLIAAAVLVVLRVNQTDFDWE